MTACPAPEELRRLLETQTADPAAAAFAAHLEGCTTCQQALEALVAGGQDPANWSRLTAVSGGRTASGPAGGGGSLRGSEQILPCPTEASGGLDDGSPGAAPASPDVPGYEVLGVLGRGGMGVVYEARQASLNRVVALKTISAGAVDSDAVVARFEAERQALALMDHPHIAKVLDAGATGSGQPFFVMELVRGSPITEYCDAHRLPTRQRLELFIAVCRAVQHAHQKGVIHRDLKPSNVLVAEVDGQPVPKVIDFGIAKAIGPRMTERTLSTQHGAVLGTLEYMSPEQSELGGMDIDTRSDVYSLGVVLYELLTGGTPLGRERVRRAGFAEILRRIKDEEPPKPSTRLPASGEGLAELAARRGTDPGRLTRAMRGDLDWVVMKALEKDRRRRYETASGFARDLERYLVGDPVEAGPPSAAYRLRKFARKHRMLLATATAFAALLVMGVLVSGVLAVRAGHAELAAKRALIRVQDEQRKTRIALDRATDEERKARRSASEARAVLEFFLGKVLAAARPKDQDGGLGIDATIRAAVDAAEPRIAAAFRDQPTAEASIRDALGLTYGYLGEPSLAIQQHDRGLQLRRDALGPEHPDTLQSLNNLAAAYWAGGRLREAVPLLEEALRLKRAGRDPDHLDTSQTMNNLAVAYREVGRLGEALTLHDEALQLQTARLGPDHPHTLITMNNLAGTYREAGRPGEALPLLKKALRLQTARLGPDHPDTLVTLTNLATAYREAGRPGEALPLLKKAFDLSQARLGPDHPGTLATMVHLAAAHWAAGRVGEAVPLFEEALRLQTARLGPDHPDTVLSLNNLAAAYRAAGRVGEAVPLLEEALRLQTARLGPDHPHAVIIMTNLATDYREVGRPDLALPLFEQALELRKAKLGPDHPDTLRVMNDLTGAYLDARRWSEAETTARECLGLREKLGLDDWWRFHTMSQLGDALIGLRHFDEAELLVVRGYEGLKVRESKIPAPALPRLLAAAVRVVRLYEGWGKEDLARAWREKLGLADLPADVFARP